MATCECRAVTSRQVRSGQVNQGQVRSRQVTSWSGRIGSHIDEQREQCYAEVYTLLLAFVYFFSSRIRV